MKIYYALSTHWDREWYKPFQGFRYDLVKTTDEIIDALESGKLDCFTFDGQTVVLEDYLEIKSHNRQRLETLIKSGKLKVGPWYVMPDELLVSGESIIRNFLTGKKTAEKFGGKTWKYGYMNDIFGHIAQMPQILGGFGIKAAFMGRGLGAKNQNFKNFIWRAPDGSECFGYKERYAALLDEFVKSDNKEKTVEEYIGNYDGKGAFILIYTHDHTGIDENTFAFENVIKKLSEKYDITEGLENIPKALEENKHLLPIQCGELITTAEIEGEFRAVTNSLSAYYPLKFHNDMCENLLDNILSPMLVLASLKGINIDRAFLDLASKYLLKNQPHDSICGCSSDIVHEDMLYRYSQLRSIANAVQTDITDHLSDNTQSKHFISVLNTNPKKYKGVFVTDLLFEQNWQNIKSDNARYQEYCVFDILDEHKNKIPYQILDIEHGFGTSEKPYIPQKDRYRVAMLGELNAFGETKFEIVPQKPTCSIRTQSDGSLSAENKYIKLEIESDGSINLHDKESGKTYRGLNTFTDDGEIGNGWFSERPIAFNGTVSSKGAKTVIEIIHCGELFTQFRVTKILNIPEHADYHTFRRSDERVDISIITDVILKKDSKTTEFKTTVSNNARDHRIKMEFPTEINGDTYHASQAFTYIERKRGISENGANFSEPEAYEKNTDGIICVKDGKHGLAFISKAGIHECGVSRDGVISAVMLRCFGRFMFENSRKNDKAQLLGTHTYYYAVSTETSFAKLNDIKKTLFETYINFDASEQKNAYSLFELDGNVNVSTVKPSEDGMGYIIRLFNPEKTAEKCTLTFKTDVKNVFTVNLAEEKLSEIKLLNNQAVLNMPHDKIETIYFEA